MDPTPREVEASASLREVRRELDKATGLEAAARAIVDRANHDFRDTLATLNRQQAIVLKAADELVARRSHREQCDLVAADLLEKLVQNR